MGNRVSKKYSFALIGLVMQLVLLACISEMKFQGYSQLAAIISSQIGVILIVVTYLTGQAKVDISAQAKASYGKSDQSLIPGA